MVAGNCGFSLAPLSGDDDAEYLKRMMVRVEGMSLDALDSTGTWEWRTFGEYLDTGVMPTGVCKTSTCPRAKNCNVVAECFSGAYKPGKVAET